MSLVRWSTSAWYIFEPCGSNWTIEVCSFGQFSVVDILRNYSTIDKKAKVDGYYTLMDRLELRAYLKLWAFWKMKKLSFKQYVKGLNALRSYGHIKCYVNDPWDNHKGIPKEFQVVPVLCNKALAKYEAKREERRKFKESPLMKALNETTDKNQ